MGTVNLIILLSCLSIVANAETKEAIKAKIAKVAIEHGEDPLLLQAIAQTESSYSLGAVGAVGEIGLFQLRPEYHPIKKGMTVREQTLLAIKLLQKLKVSCGPRFLQCWNMGETRAKQKNFKRTRYEAKVQNAYKNILHSRSFSSVKGTVIAHEKAK